MQCVRAGRVGGLRGWRRWAAAALGGGGGRLRRAPGAHRKGVDRAPQARKGIWSLDDQQAAQGEGHNGAVAVEHPAHSRLNNRVLWVPVRHRGAGRCRRPFSLASSTVMRSSTPGSQSALAMAALDGALSTGECVYSSHVPRALLVDVSKRGFLLFLVLFSGWSFVLLEGAGDRKSPCEPCASVRTRAKRPDLEQRTSSPLTSKPSKW